MKLVAKLTAQVPAALRELLSGIERAHAGGEVPENVHAALVATLLRLLFVLRAEAEGLLDWKRRAPITGRGAQPPSPSPFPRLGGRGARNGISR